MIWDHSNCITSENSEKDVNHVNLHSVVASHLVNGLNLRKQIKFMQLIRVWVSVIFPYLKPGICISLFFNIKFEELTWLQVDIVYHVAIIKMSFKVGWSGVNSKSLTIKNNGSVIAFINSFTKCGSECISSIQKFSLKWKISEIIFVQT